MANETERIEVLMARVGMLEEALKGSVAKNDHLHHELFLMSEKMVNLRQEFEEYIELTEGAKNEGTG